MFQRRYIFPLILLLGIVLALSGIAGAEHTEEPALPRFGIVGLAEKQTAILNVVVVDELGADRASCRLNLSFVDENGIIVVDTREVELRPGVAFAVSLSAEEFGLEERTPIRAVLARAEDDRPSDCTRLVPTLEIVNEDGETQVLYYPPDPVHPPDPI